MTEEKKTILIVDDTPTNIDVVMRVLSQIYHVQAAINGELALKIIAKKVPDLILLDIMMPGIDGYETCRRIKANPETANIPVIFLTAKSEAEDEEKGLSAGAVDYMAKPLSPPLLKQRIKTQLLIKEYHTILVEQNLALAPDIVERLKIG